MALSTGMRSGELRGLQWKDVDFTNRIIHVTGTLVNMEGRYFIDTPKTRTSKRDIPMRNNDSAVALDHYDKCILFLWYLGQ